MDNCLSSTISKGKKFFNANFFLLNSLLFNDFKKEFLKGVSSKVKKTQSSRVYIEADLGCLYIKAHSPKQYPSPLLNNSSSIKSYLSSSKNSFTILKFLSLINLLFLLELLLPLKLIIFSLYFIGLNFLIFFISVYSLVFSFSWTLSILSELLFFLDFKNIKSFDNF